MSVFTFSSSQLHGTWEGAVLTCHRSSCSHSDQEHSHWFSASDGRVRLLCVLLCFVLICFFFSLKYKWGAHLFKITNVRALNSPDKKLYKVIGSSSLIVIQNKQQRLKDLVQNMTCAVLFKTSLSQYWYLFVCCSF